MIALLNECGLFGVGAFWVVIEILHQQQCGGIGVAELKSYLSFYGKQAAWDELIISKTEKALFDTKLLILKDGMVYSDRVINNLKRREELSKYGRENAQKRWGGNATPLVPHRDPNAIKGKESKGKEIKEKEKKDLKTTTQRQFEKPTAQQVFEYAKSLSFDLDGQSFVDYYEARGWSLGRSPMRSWQAAVRTWKTRRSQNGRIGTHETRNQAIGEPERVDSKYSGIVKTVRTED